MLLQDEARRLAEQVHALEDTRNRWNAEFTAREAAVAKKEDALAADIRQKDADDRRRLAQEQQVRLASKQLMTPKSQWRIKQDKVVMRHKPQTDCLSMQS